ncbi:MAG: hypothetical protein QNI84_13235 [Henriciella sp.]|nr:hypothetical protein [Henriciella sp.]
MFAFVAEYGAIDAALPAGIDKLSPNKQGITSCGTQDDFFAGTCEEFSSPSVPISIGAVVPLVERKAGLIAVFGEPPQRAI